jgi:hypothetical protein
MGEGGIARALGVGRYNPALLSSHSLTTCVCALPQYAIFIPFNASPDMHFQTRCMTSLTTDSSVISGVSSWSWVFREEQCFIRLIERNTVSACKWILVTAVVQSNRIDWNTFFAQCHQIANGLLTHVYGTDTVASDLLRSHVGSISCEWELGSRLWWMSQ